MDQYSVVQAKAHFSEILAKVEAGQEVTITRRGAPIARLSSVKRPKRPLDLEALAKFRATMKTSTLGAEALIRRMRDEKY
jgi:prevent-host-death family protein